MDWLQLIKLYHFGRFKSSATDISGASSDRSANSPEYDMICISQIICYSKGGFGMKPENAHAFPMTEREEAILRLVSIAEPDGAKALNANALLALNGGKSPKEAGDEVGLSASAIKAIAEAYASDGAGKAPGRKTRPSKPRWKGVEAEPAALAFAERWGGGLQGGGG
jgi:hypothetical protein